MNVGWAILAALASAGCAAVSNVLQHRSVGAAPAGRGLRLHLLGYLIRRPTWLLGLLAAGGALAFHALALWGGQLAVVQPLLVSGLLFALPASAILDGRRPSAAEWGWALLLISGLVAFLEGARPTGGSRLPSDGRLLPLIAVAAALVVAAVLLGAGVLRQYRAGLFGLATGIAYGIAAPLIKYSTALATTDPIRLVTGWPAYALVLVGVTAIILNQTAYQSGPLGASLPPLALADPIVSTIIGALTFGEQLSTTPTAVAGQVVGGVAIAIAIIMLARRVSRPPSTSDRSAVQL